jgi:hypothetical protein
MRTLYVSRKVHVWQVGNNAYRAAIYQDRRSAVRLNELLGSYPADTAFKKDDEPQFTFSGARMDEVFEALQIKRGLDDKQFLG